MHLKVNNDISYVVREREDSYAIVKCANGFPIESISEVSTCDAAGRIASELNSLAEAFNEAQHALAKAMSVNEKVLSRIERSLNGGSKVNPFA
jgi:hypothetical protein